MITPAASDSSDPTVSYAGLLVPGCDVCGKHFLLYACVGDDRYCSTCWKQAGRPFPKRDDERVAWAASVEHEKKTVDMGGSAAYQMRKPRKQQEIAA